MSNLLTFVLVFAAMGAGGAWLIHPSWWAPILGGATGVLAFVALLVWALSKTDIG